MLALLSGDKSHEALFLSPAGLSLLSMASKSPAFYAEAVNLSFIPIVCGRIKEFPNVQWLFLLEGAPAVLLGFLICWRLAPDPERAAFLKPAELQWLLDRSVHCTPARTGLPSSVSTLHLNMCTASARHQAAMAPEEIIHISHAWSAGFR